MACLVALVASLSGAAGTRAQQPAPDIDLALVLAVDVSRSMDPDEQRLQRAGYAAAFRHPEVQAAIRSGIHGRIAVAYLEWGGYGRDRVIVPWTFIASAAEAAAFADDLDILPIDRWSGTSISGGLHAAGRLLMDPRVAGARRVIDVSGDGPNNTGPPIVSTRDELVARGIVINGLPIMLKVADSYFGLPDLDRYYAACVIGGPGAFIVPVREVEEFPSAIRRKLVLEISGTDLPIVPAAATDASYDCMIGEKLRQRWIREEGR
jgi:hypothetical protein